MARINFEVPDVLAMKFKSLVGSNHQSSTLREFVEQICYNNANEKELETKLTELNSSISLLEIERKSIEFQLKQIRDKRKEQKIKEQQEKNELMNFDPFAHLQDKAKLNAIQIARYRIEKGKFLPDWAKKRNPENPKEYAIKLLKHLEGKENDKRF